MPDRIARAHAPGRIGSTPQDTTAILTGARVAGALNAFLERIAPRRRVDAVLGKPAVAAADPGYFRDDVTDLHITDAVRRMQPGVMRQVPDYSNEPHEPGSGR